MRKINFNRILSLILSLCLLIGGIGVSPIEVHADGETQTGKVIYVDSAVDSAKDDLEDKTWGYSPEKPMKTLKGAYGKVPLDNVKSTIVVMSKLELAPDSYTDETSITDLDYAGGTIRSHTNSEYKDCYNFPTHKGEVVITSTYGGTPYDSGALDFNQKAFSLNGDTTFENIKISDYAQIIFACYHKLTLGAGITRTTDNVTYYPANFIIMGVGKEKDGKSIQTYTPSDVYFTMNSGTINNLYGGNFLAGSVDADAADCGVKIEINSGTISTLFGSSRHGTVSAAPHKTIDITVNGGTITNLYGAHNGATISGDLKISVNQAAKVKTTISGPRASGSSCATIEGDTILNIVGTKTGWSMPSVDSNFDVLELTNTELKLDSVTGFWDKIEKLTMTDDSTLAFSAAPTKAVDVTVTQATSGAWNTTTALISAPSDTEDVFTLESPVGYSLTKAGTDPVTWTLTANQTTAPMASVNGTEYATLEGAIGAATDDATITLLDDCELPTGTVYDKEITYDLNGHTLTGDAFNLYSAKVKDSFNGEGLLKVSQDKLSLVSNNEGYMPVWDNTNSGYRFAEVTIEDRNVDATGSSLVFAMRPSFGSDTIEQLVAAGYKTGMVRVGVRITWTDPDTKEEKTQDLALEDSWLSTMYSNPSSPKGVKFTISGGETIKDFTATTIVWSNLSNCPNMEITGETHKYSATAEE